MKYVRRGLAIAGLILVVLVVVGGAYVWRTWDAVWDVPLPAIHASSDPAVIATGAAAKATPAGTPEPRDPETATARCR